MIIKPALCLTPELFRITTNLTIFLSRNLEESRAHKLCEVNSLLVARVFEN